MRRFNFKELCCFIVFTLFDSFLIYIVNTKKISLYVESNMIKYMYIAIGMISVITIFQIKNIFTCIENSNVMIKLLPIVLALILGLISINSIGTFKSPVLHLQ